MTRLPKRVRVLRLAGCGVLMSTLTFAASSYSQDLGSSLGTGGALDTGGSLGASGALGTGGDAGATGTPLQRGLDETIRSGAAGNNIGDSLRSGLGQAGRSALESPAQRLQRDQGQRLQNQLYGQGQSTLDDAGIQRPGFRSGGALRSDIDGAATGQLRQGVNDGQFQGAAGLRAANSQMGGQRAGTQGPMLGVSVQPAERGVLVTDVRAGTAAEQAGLQRNDVIVGANGQSIQSRQALIQAVRASAGSEMTVEVIRNGQSQQLTAMIAQDDSTYRMARPAFDAEQNNGSVSGSYAELRQQVMKLREDLAALRQEVNALNVTGNDRSLLNNTESTPLDTAPVDVAAPGATTTPADPAAATDAADATESNDDLFDDN